MDFLRELFKINENMMPDFENMTDHQLMDLCAELEMEDMCELDDDGRIVNREELIADLKAGHGPDPFLDRGIGDEPSSGMTDVEADADTLASAGYGTDEDYGTFEGAMPQGVIRNKQRIANMTDEEKKARFKGVSKEKAAEMERSHCVKPGTYAKHCTTEVKESAVPIMKHRGKRMTNERKSFNFYKPYKPVKENKTFNQAHEDKIGNAGMKGMKTKDRPFGTAKMRFKDWLIGNTFMSNTCSGELAGTMKLREGMDPFDHQSDKLAQLKWDYQGKHPKKIKSVAGQGRGKVSVIANEETNNQGTSVFRVHVPANIYDGKYYDYRTVPVVVAAQSEKEAIAIVNKYQSTALEIIAKKRMRSGARTVPYVKIPAAENVYFKGDYYTKPMIDGSVNALTRDGKVERFEGEKSVWSRGGNIRDTQLINYRDVAGER